MRARARIARLALPLLLGFAGVGCHTYKYFDVAVAFDPVTFTNVNDVFRILVCRVTVSGADSAVFNLPASRPPDRPMAATCPNVTGSGDSYSGGTFEWSSFADSGNVTFKVEGFDSKGEQANCLVGSGMVTIAVSGMMTNPGTLTVAKVADGCQGTTM
jgi:hypothetical protein